MLACVAGCSKREESKREVVAYYSIWSAKDPKDPLKAASIPVELLDEVIYAFIGFDEKGNLFFNDEKEEVEGGNLAAFIALKKRKPTLTLLFAVGGWGEGSVPFAKMSHKKSTRSAFAKNALAFCEKYGFDGIDIDWEFPKTIKEGKDLALLLKELKETFKTPSKKWIVSTALPGHFLHYKKLPLTFIGAQVDVINVMTYDFHGPWKDPSNLVTNHQTALLPPLLGSSKLCVSRALKHYAKYIPKNKLRGGIPLFFNTYSEVTGGIAPSHYGSPYEGPAPNPKIAYAKGWLYYHQAHEAIANGEAEGFYDPLSHAFSVYFSTLKVFGSGLDKQTLKNNCHYFVNEGYRGAMLWQLSGDTKNWEALQEINQAVKKAPQLKS